MHSTCTLAGVQRTRTTRPPVPVAAPAGEEEAEVAPSSAGAEPEPARDSSAGESVEDDTSSLSESGNSCSSGTSSSSVDDSPHRKKKKRPHKTNTANDKRGRSSLRAHRAPIISTQPQPPRGLKLPTVGSGTLRRLTNRRKVVSVDDVLSPKPFGGRAAPTTATAVTTADYLRGVAIIAAYRSYYFPRMAVQWAMYQVWLHDRAAGLSVAAVRHLDEQGRTILAQYPDVYHTPADLSEGVRELPPAQPSSRPVTAYRPPQPGRRGREVCFRWNSGICTNGNYCKYLHACRVCGLAHKAVAVHGPRLPGNAIRPLAAPAFPAGRH